jgi:hypothetical protein
MRGPTLRKPAVEDYSSDARSVAQYSLKRRAFWRSELDFRMRGPTLRKPPMEDYSSDARSVAQYSLKRRAFWRSELDLTGCERGRLDR